MRIEKSNDPSSPTPPTATPDCQPKDKGGVGCSSWSESSIDKLLYEQSQSPAPELEHGSLQPIGKLQPGLEIYNDGAGRFVQEPQCTEERKAKRDHPTPPKESERHNDGKGWYLPPSARQFQHARSLRNDSTSQGQQVSYNNVANEPNADDLLPRLYGIHSHLRPQSAASNG